MFSSLCNLLIRGAGQFPLPIVLFLRTFRLRPPRLLLQAPGQQIAERISGIKKAVPDPIGVHRDHLWA